MNKRRELNRDIHVGSAAKKRERLKEKKRLHLKLQPLPESEKYYSVFCKLLK
jgi:hypothetical protein